MFLQNQKTRNWLPNKFYSLVFYRIYTLQWTIQNVQFFFSQQMFGQWDEIQRGKRSKTTDPCLLCRQFSTNLYEGEKDMFWRAYTENQHSQDPQENKPYGADGYGSKPTRVNLVHTFPQDIQKHVTVCSTALVAVQE